MGTRPLSRPGLLAAGLVAVAATVGIGLAAGPFGGSSGESPATTAEVDASSCPDGDLDCAGPGAPATTGPSGPTGPTRLDLGEWTATGGATVSAQGWVFGHAGALDHLLVPVEARPGDIITVGAEIRASEFPARHVRIGVRINDAYNLKSVAAAVAGAGEWQEIAAAFAIPDDATLVEARFIGPDEGSGERPLELRNPQVHLGLHTSGSGDAKRPFEGTRVRIDADGRWTLDGAPFTPVMVYADHDRADWSLYRDAGFNTIHNVLSPQHLERAAAAEMNAMFELSVFAWTGGWAGGSGVDSAVRQLRDWAGQLRESPQYGRLIGLYWDNEDHDAYAHNIAVIEEARRQFPGLPIWMLRGDYAAVPEMAAHVDAVGTYLNADDIGPTGGGVLGLDLLRRLAGQTAPVSIAQLQHSAAAGPTAERVEAARSQGATGWAYWRDDGDIEAAEWWPDLLGPGRGDS